MRCGRRWMDGLLKRWPVLSLGKVRIGNFLHRSLELGEGGCIEQSLRALLLIAM